MAVAVSQGDMARHFVQQNQNLLLRRALDQHTLELASGVTGDVSQHLGGDFSELARVRNGLTVINSYEDANTTLTLRADGMQLSLELIREKVGTFAGTAQNTASMARGGTIDVELKEAERQLEDLRATLNTRVSEQSLFAGIAADQQAIAPLADIYAALDPLIAGLTTAADIEAAISTWMADPAGFDTVAYTGDAARPDVRVGRAHSVSLTVTAGAPAMKEAFEGLLIAAYGHRNGNALTPDEKAALLTRSADVLRNAEDGLTSLQAEVGQTQARLEEAKTATAAEKSALQMSEAELIGVDAYETASELEATRLQLELLYTVTARLSRLSLAEYLR
ncbi:MAG: flagellin [Pseudomonadota bacterium]